MLNADNFLKIQLDKYIKPVLDKFLGEFDTREAIQDYSYLYVMN